MKKSLAIVLALLTICVFPLSASAHHGRRVSQGVCGGIQNAFHHGTSCRACRHADANGDGICDNCNTGWSCPHADADGDGICDSCGNTCGYVDADGNGICDNWGSGTGNGTGAGTGSGSASGSGNSWGGGHHGGGHHGGRHHR